MASERSIAPDALWRLTCSAVYWRRLDSNNIEAVAHRLERLMLKQRFGCNLGIVNEHIHLVLLISLGYVCYMNASCSVSSLLYRSVRRAVLESSMSNQNIGRVYGVCHSASNFMAVVAQVDSHVNLLLWHRNQKYILKCLVHIFCLVVRLPLLK